MEPETQAPIPTRPTPDANPNLENPNSIDLGAILLPNKQVHAPENAQRASAGVLLAQEQSATLPPPPTPAPASTPAAPTEAGERVSEKLKPSTAPLQTYKGDIEKYVREKNVSVVSVAAAEAERRTSAQTRGVADFIREEAEGKPAHSGWFYAGFIGGGALCIMLALGALYFIFSQYTKLPAATEPLAPFIAVDGVVDVPVAPGEGRAEILAALNQEKTTSTLSLGLIEQLRLISAATSTSPNNSPVSLLSAQTFLATIAPDLSPDFLRTVSPLFLLGAHTFSTPQAFLILKTDSYEQAFSGMLSWEPSMRADLSPLFDYTPSAHINGTVGTSTPDAASAFSQSQFVDAIVENHDARVLKNSAGDIYFLWTFLDRTTIAITTNEYTLREVISRLKDAPLLPSVGQ